MEFQEIIQKLEKMLTQPLPGRVGQMMMSPQPVDETRFAEGALKNPRKGAVLMLFYPEDNQTLVPFIKRPSYDGVHSGQIAFPGGKWEEQDVDLSMTALREAEEEIGIDPKKVRLVGKLSDLFIPPSNFLVSPFIGFMEETPLFKPDPYEVDRIINCPVNQLTDVSIRKEGKITVREQYQLKAPYFDIENEMVWGATAMMLGEFMYLWENS
ncbi:8-oxo-dGTP pyrophosphatase MutT, NUDIX family [Belliella buryatensis]|uniref:8-oxo-dGTP pyrophosphatase MutT, NUDIX family n=1 Tax=Belliella buryatensis TaxID=1500549 RepID=A0A239CLT7_9BACT|nr:CoA pyrophosphatase [Belliella buryatensis]SNS20852.1 8-oxo-dGTP pyrophosphatase MutT, NUDIX family [Belliella buryatensis]